MKVVFLSALAASIVATGMTGMGSPKAMNCSRCAISGGGGTNCGFVRFVQWRAVIGGSDGVWNRNAQCIPSAPGHINLWTVSFNRWSWSFR
jgi:hypothetical protein